MYVKKALPSLNALAAFEAAARHLSFTDAAKEFDILQPTISRHISSLESELGTALFIRKKPKLALTYDGEILLAAVSNGFGQITHAVNTIRDRNSTQSFVVMASLGFATCFLMPRLADFNSRYPYADLELVTNDFYRKYNPDEFDVAVVFSEKANAPGRDIRLLFPEELIAVCAPSYLEGQENLSDDELVKERLLHIHEPNHLEDWNTFLSDAAVKAPQSTASNRYTAYTTYLHSALSGEGIALGWSFYIDDLIRANRLRLASNRRVRTERGFFCCISDRGLHKPAARDFANWLDKAVDLKPL